MLAKQTWLLYHQMDENEGFLASQGTDISIKTLLENAEYFAEFI